MRVNVFVDRLACRSAMAVVAFAPQRAFAGCVLHHNRVVNHRVGGASDWKIGDARFQRDCVAIDETGTGSKRHKHIRRCVTT